MECLGLDEVEGYRRRLQALQSIGGAVLEVANWPVYILCSQRWGVALLPAGLCAFVSGLLHSPCSLVAEGA